MLPFSPPSCRGTDSRPPSCELRCRLMDSQDLGDFWMPLLDWLEMPDLETSSKQISNFIEEGSVFSRRARVLTASQKVCWPLHQSTQRRFLSTRVSYSRHQEKVYYESSSPTMLSVSMIFWSPYQGFESRSSVIFGFCHSTGCSSTSEVSQECSDDSLIWLQTLDSSFFSSILLSRTEQKLRFLLPLRSKAGCTLRLSAFFIFFRAGGFSFLTILGMPSLSSEQDSLETEQVCANFLEGMSPETEAERSTPCAKLQSLMVLLSTSSTPRQLRVRSSYLIYRSWQMVSLRSSTFSSPPISYSSNLFLMISFTTTSPSSAPSPSPSSSRYTTCTIELAVIPISSMLSSLSSILAPRQQHQISSPSSFFKLRSTSLSSAAAVILGSTCSFSPFPVIFLKKIVIIYIMQVITQIHPIGHISASSKIQDSSSPLKARLSTEPSLAMFMVSSEMCLMALRKSMLSVEDSFPMLSSNFLLQLMRSFRMLQSRISYQLLTDWWLSIHLSMLAVLADN